MTETPLQPVHERLGASFTDFAGWNMPLRYSSELAEHEAVRTAAGLFDLSHMGEIRVTGPEAAEALDYALAGTMSKLTPGRAKYTLLLAEDGGILDDLIVYCLAEQDYLVVANAGNRELAARELTARAAAFDAEVRDESLETALIAVQGPKAAEVLGAVGIESEPLDGLKYYRIMPGIFEGEDLWIARTGYTGEDGFEVYLPNAAAESLWDSLMAVGDGLGLLPCGLAARDTLRLEAGMPLYGNELGPDVFPHEVGLEKVVALAQETDFVGKDALAAGPAEGARTLIALTAEGRRAPRAGYPVFAGDEEVGVVTSGALSPTLGTPVAMAFVTPEAAERSDLTVDIRGKRLPVTVTTLPFYSRKETA